MDITGLLIEPLLFAVVHDEVRQDKKYKTRRGRHNRNADHEGNQVVGSVDPEVLDNHGAVAHRHALEFAEEVECNLSRMVDLATDVVSTRVEEPELRHRIRHKVRNDPGDLGEPEKGADCNREDNRKTNRRPHADKHADKDGPRYLEGILAPREHAVVIDAA